MSNDVRRAFPKLPSSRKVPDEIKAVIGKLARDPHGTSQASRNLGIPDQRVLGHIANKTVNNINDARNLFQVLPDMDYARQIIISATISPGDLTDTKLIYSIKNDDLESSLTGPMLRVIQDFFNDTYRIRKLLHPILNDVLFEKGSYPVLIMPESSIDQIINGASYKTSSLESTVASLESFLNEECSKGGIYRPYGILGFPKSKLDLNVSTSFESFCNDDAYVAQSYISFPSLENFESNTPARRRAVEGFNKINESHTEVFTVTDNPNILKHPMVLETKRKLAIRRIYGGKLRGDLGKRARQQTARDGNVIRFDGKSVGVSQEASTKGTMTSLKDVETTFYTERRYQHVPVQPLMTKSQIGAQTYGHPLVMHLPAESVLPIHVPGNPKEHVGYYILLDINGNPLNVTSHDNYYDDIRGTLNQNDQFSSQVLQTVRRGLDGQGTINNEIIQEMTRLNGDTIESDLLARLRAGPMGGDYNISRTEHINQLMFSRQLKGQKTIMLYVPVEMMTYIAFDYNEFGVGKSMLEDGKILGSIRAALMLSNTLASINNAAGGKTINITLDPNDENPAETVEFMLNEHAKVNSEGYSRIIGQTHPLGLADQIQNHGVNVMVEGNTRYPETKFDVQRREGTNSPIDTDLEDKMQDKHWQFFGLSPEMASGKDQPEFATTVVQNNLMLLKRVIQNQEKLDPFLTDMVRSYTLNSGILLDQLREIVELNKKYLDKDKRNPDGIDDFIYEAVSSLLVELPAPEINDTEKQLQAFTAYTAGLTEIIDAYFSADMFITDTTNGMDEIIEPVKKNIIAEFQRRWLRSRSIYPELDIFNSMEEDESPVFNFMEINTQHMDGLVKSLMKYMKRALSATKKRAAEAQKIEDEKNALSEAASGGDGFGGDALPDDGTDLPVDEEGNDDDLGLDEPLDDALPDDDLAEIDSDAEEDGVPEEEEQEEPDGNSDGTGLDDNDLSTLEIPKP